MKFSMLGKKEARRGASNALHGAGLDGPDRLREDHEALRESSLGAGDIAAWAQGKKTKPRAIRDWEKNQ